MERRGMARGSRIVLVVMALGGCGQRPLLPIPAISASAGGAGGAGGTGAPGTGGSTGTGGLLPGVGGAGASPPGSGGTGAGGSGPTVSTNYAINPAHDGTQPDEAIRTPLAKRWFVNVAGEVVYPVIASGRLFLAFADPRPKLAAYDLQTGAVLWGPLLLPAAVWLTYDVGNLFGLDQNGSLWAWDAATGRALWTVKLTTQRIFNAFPVATGGLVYVNGLGSGGTVYAVDSATGAVRWTTDYHGGDGAVAIGDGVLYEV